MQSATLPPTLRLDQAIAPLSLPGFVQVMYTTDAYGYVALRVRYQTSATATPQNWCIVMRPSATPPPGVQPFRWVSADTSILSNPAYGQIGTTWNYTCQNP